MIQKILDISTAHIKQRTAEMIDVGEIELCVFPKDEFGWFIFVPDKADLRDRNIPDELVNILKHGIENDCTWVMLDRDGDTIAELETFDW